MRTTTALERSRNLYTSENKSARHHNLRNGTDISWQEYVYYNPQMREYATPNTNRKARRWLKILLKGRAISRILVIGRGQNTIF
jgi:hypothetical protein